jgi:hypothetical protein
VGITAGSAAAQPTVIGPGLVDDRVVQAAQICSRKDFELRTVSVELVNQDRSIEPMASAKQIAMWCKNGDFAMLIAHADVLGAMIALCRDSPAARDPSDNDKEKIDREKKIDDACAGRKQLLDDEALRFNASAREKHQRTAREMVIPELTSGPAEAAAGAVATTTDIVARAVASFLEKRAKAEFKEFILRRLRQKVCVELKLQPWTPNTCAYLGSAEDDATLPLSLGTGLRSALLQDAAELPDHVIANLLTPTEKAPGNTDMLLARVGFETAMALMHHRDLPYIATVFKDLAENPLFCGGDTDCGNVQAMLAVVARALVMSRTEQITKAEALDFTFAAKVLVKELAEDLRGHPPDNAASRRILGNDKAKIFVDDDRKPLVLLNATTALADAIRTLGNVIDAPIDDEKTHFRNVAIQAGAVISQLDAVVTATSDLIANPDVRAKITVLHRELVYAGSLVTALVQADLAKTVTLVLTQVADSEQIKGGFPGAVARVLSFAVDLATAKDSKEAEAVIEGVAAPVNAWQGKREDTVFSISGFVGGTYGRESARAGGADVKSTSIGPIAALGLDINAPGRRNRVFHDYVRPGLFLSVIDVGALMSYSYDTPAKPTAGDKSAQAGQTTPIGFTQVFSPGAFLRFGILDTPLVIGGGVSFLPRGRSITMTDASMTTTSEERSAVRWSVFVAVDVTVLPF